MADVNFDCPYCKQNLDAPEDLIGTNIECPACGKMIRVVQPVQSMLDSQRIVPPPPPSPGPVAGKETMDATTRIELPAEYLTPERKNRVIFIKRTGH